MVWGCRVGSPWPIKSNLYLTHPSPTPSPPLSRRSSELLDIGRGQGDSFNKKKIVIFILRYFHKNLTETILRYQIAHWRTILLRITFEQNKMAHLKRLIFGWINICYESTTDYNLKPIKTNCLSNRTLKYSWSLFTNYTCRRRGILPGVARSSTRAID